MFAKITIMDVSSLIFIEVVNDRVEKLGQLKAKGILTDKEFNQAKAKLLG